MVAGGKLGKRISRPRASRPAVALITDARRSPVENLNRRRSIYMALQLARLPLMAAGALVYVLSHNMGLAAALAGLSIPLPWIAVMIANEPNDVDKRAPKVYKPAQIRRERAQARNQLSSPQREALMSSNSSTESLPDFPTQQSVHATSDTPHIIDIDSL